MPVRKRDAAADAATANQIRATISLLGALMDAQADKNRPQPEDAPAVRTTK